MRVGEGSERLLREAAFHDALVESEGRPADRFYAVNGRSWSAYCDLLVQEVTRLAAPERPARVLEYGCGIGSFSSRVLAEHGFGVTGIDISPLGVSAAEEYAAAAFPEVGCEYRVMDAERLEFPDGSFDVVCGNGILHHLDLGRAYGEIARVLDAAGSAVFTEPLGHNPLINLYRRFTPDQRTSDEHPLRMSDLRDAREHFGEIDVRFFHLLALLAIPFADRRVFDPLLAGLDRADAALLHRRSPLRRYGWFAVLRLSRPRS
ncbi:MAG TPA: class I SAM-dependent methyltransferase [Gaiellaceae bacterium]|nr:class I SAM-dependent methyltransferase [Gaiellaceae bacterium]